MQRNYEQTTVRLRMRVRVALTHWEPVSEKRGVLKASLQAAFLMALKPYNKTEVPGTY